MCALFGVVSAGTDLDAITHVDAAIALIETELQNIENRDDC